MVSLLLSFILRAILKTRVRCSVLFRSPYFLSFADFFAKYAADSALLLPDILPYFMPFFYSFQNLTFKCDCIMDYVIHQLFSLRLGVPLSQELGRQDLLSSQQSFTFSPLKFVKLCWTHWLYSSLTSGLLSFHIRLFAMWLLADFNLVRSLNLQLTVYIGCSFFTTYVFSML